MTIYQIVVKTNTQWEEHQDPEIFTFANLGDARKCYVQQEKKYIKEYNINADKWEIEKQHCYFYAYSEDSFDYVEIQLYEREAC